ncbi:hypothetical protein U1Q18_032658 [Sarracenia purpurea var. burkii]
MADSSDQSKAESNRLAKTEVKVGDNTLSSSIKDGGKNYEDENGNLNKREGEGAATGTNKTKADFLILGEVWESTVTEEDLGILGVKASDLNPILAK